MIKQLSDNLRSITMKLRNVSQNCDSDEWMKFFNRINAFLEMQARVADAVTPPEKIMKLIDKQFKKNDKD